MKYYRGFKRTQYGTAVVEADSVEKAEELFDEEQHDDEIFMEGNSTNETSGMEWDEEIGTE